MTDSEKKTHKEKVNKVMRDHLTSLGYPDMTSQEIFNECKAMWIKLEEAGLIVGDMNFQMFELHANQACVYSEIMDIMGI